MDAVLQPPTRQYQPCYTCPRDGDRLWRSDAQLVCPKCAHEYPIVRGVPVLIDSETSVFDPDDIVRSAEIPSNGSGYWRQRGRHPLYRRMVGKIQNHTVHISHFRVRDAIAMVTAEQPDARILVIGAANNDFGHKGIIYSDVRLGANVSVIFDAHAIPYPDAYFDLIIAVAILEHVVDPWQCAREITRTVAHGGYVYSSIPFLQPVHMGAYDFTRFTYLGHRGLFRWFEEIEGGPEMGPATSAAFAIQSALLSLSDRPNIRKIMRLTGILGAAACKPIDLLLRRHAATFDGAASTFFFGRKRNSAISDRELLTMYRGAQ